MNMKTLILFNLVIMAIVDVLIAMFIKDWSTTRIVSIVMISVPFILATVVPFLSPKGENEYYFTTTTSLISVAYIVIELIVGLIFIVTNMDGLIPIIIQIVLCILVIIILIVFSVNNRSIQRKQNYGKEDKEIIRSARDNMKDAFTRAKAPAKKIIEPAMDKVNSIAGYGPNYQELDEQIAERTEALLSASLSDNESEVGAISKQIIDLCATRRKIRT